MPKCIWEKEECELRAEGGEFYCLTHLQESEDHSVWKFANAGDPPGTTRKLTLEETEAYLERLRNRGKPQGATP